MSGCARKMAQPDFLSDRSTSESIGHLWNVCALAFTRFVQRPANEEQENG